MLEADTDAAPYEEMGPSLLTRQPATAPDKLPKPETDWSTIYQHLESRMSALRTWRYSFWSHWAILAEFFIPRRYHWVITANKYNKGKPINDNIIDGVGTLAVNVCSSGLWTGLTSPSRPWFKMDVALPWITLDADGSAWLEDTQQRIYTVLAQSNFYKTMAQAFQDVTVFGTAPVICYEDFEDVVRFYLPCAGEYFLGVGSRLDVDTLYREFVLTVLQIVEMFKLENCPPEVQKMWETGGGSLEQEFVVACAIEPNFAISKKGKGKEQDQATVVPGIFTYREVYWVKGNKCERPLSKRGFNDKPFMALRWSEVSNDPYGRSPCMDALGDNKQVQMETRRKAEFIEKGVRPPMGANPELKNEPSSIIPGMITYMSTDGGKKGFWPLFEVNFGWLAPIVADIEKVSARINSALFVDLFMAISRMEGVQPRNELELTKRDLERLQQLGPIINSAENELSTMIRRVLGIMTRRKMLKPMPKSLQGVPLKIDYTSIMKMAQRSAESVSMKDFFSTAGVLSSAAKAASVPDPIRTVNLDKALAHYGDLVNFPTDCLFTPKEVESHDQARAQAKQQAQIPGMAAAGVNAAKTLSETQVPGGNALNALLTGQTGQQ